jgi:hypothetical protein
MNAELPLLVRRYVFFQILGYFWEENPPTYRPIGEIEGQIQETNIFLWVA